MTVAGASGVVLTGIEIRNGRNGIVGVNGAHLSLSDLNVHDNTGFGISLQTGSSAVLSGVTTGPNGVNGLDVQTGSAATVTGTLTATGNRVFGSQCQRQRVHPIASYRDGDRRYARHSDRHRRQRIHQRSYERDQRLPTISRPA